MLLGLVPRESLRAPASNSPWKRFSRKSNFSRPHLDGPLDPWRRGYFRHSVFFGARSTNDGSDRRGGHNVPRKPLERERFGPLKGFTANRLPRRSHTHERPPLIDRDPPSRTFARSVTYNGDIDTGPHRMSPSNELPQTLSCRERRS